MADEQNLPANLYLAIGVIRHFAFIFKYNVSLISVHEVSLLFQHLHVSKVWKEKKKSMMLLLSKNRKEELPRV